MNLTYEERHSALWIKLNEYYEARLQLLRAKNDAVMTPEETSRIRGRIAEVRSFLALSEDKTVLADD